jgi:hypothetical protein
MKKITLLLTLLMTSIGFSQAIPVTFQVDITTGAKSGASITPADANWYSDSGLTSTTVEDLASDSPDHMNAGKIVSSSTGAKWQNAQLLMTDNYMDLTTTKTITLEVYSDNAQDFLLKVEESLGTGANTEKSFSHTGTGWETIVVDYSTPPTGQPVPNDQYKLLEIFPCYSADFTAAAFDSTTYVDNITTVVGDAITAPAVPSSGASEPTNAAADVYSLFGNTYTNTAPSSYSQSWGQGTVSDYTAGSDVVKKYAGLNFQAITLSSTLDLSDYTHFHIDVWTPIANAFGIKFQDFGSDDIDEFPNTNDSEFEVQSSTTQSAEAWVGHDFAIADFTGLTGTANLGQIQVLLGSATGGTSGDAYIDNIYFWKAPTASVDDFFAKAVKLHPNPANGIVKFSTVTNEALEVSVYDLLGKQVIPAQTIQSELNIASLNPGMYFVNMKQGASVATKKLLVN